MMVFKVVSGFFLLDVSGIWLLFFLYYENFNEIFDLMLVYLIYYKNCIVLNWKNFNFKEVRKVNE